MASMRKPRPHPSEDPEPPGVKLLTSAPDWAREEQQAWLEERGTEAADPPEPESKAAGPFFVAGDAVRVRENHAIHPNASGVITEIRETIAIVELEGVRKPVALPFSELEKATLPRIIQSEEPRGQDSG